MNSTQNSTLTETDRLLIHHAYTRLNTPHVVLMPESTATITYPAFNPFRAVEVIAVVSIKAVVRMREVVLTYSITDGEKI